MDNSKKNTIYECAITILMKRLNMDEFIFSMQDAESAVGSGMDFGLHVNALTKIASITLVHDA